MTAPGRTALSWLKVLTVDTLSIALFLLMTEFLVIAFSGRRSLTGLLATPEEILDFLHYPAIGWTAAALAILWNFTYRVFGTSPGRAMMFGVQEDEENRPWNRTTRGWFGAILIQWTFFSGWLITEVDMIGFLTQSEKAMDIVRGLLHPSSAVLHQGLVLLVQTIFLAFMATAFAIPVAFVLSFAAARNLTRATGSFRCGFGWFKFEFCSISCSKLIF